MGKQTDTKIKETIIAICLYYGDCSIKKAKAITAKILSVYPQLK